MRSIAIAAFSGLLFASTASAMPSDLPWNDYTCKDGKTLTLKFLSDGESIDVKLGDGTLTLHPVDEKAEAGFQAGIYTSTDLKLKLGPDKKWAALHGKAATGGPYKHCTAKTS